MPIRGATTSKMLVCTYLDVIYMLNSVNTVTKNEFRNYFEKRDGRDVVLFQLKKVWKLFVTCAIKLCIC